MPGSEDVQVQVLAGLGDVHYREQEQEHDHAHAH